MTRQLLKRSLAIILAAALLPVTCAADSLDLGGIVSKGKTALLMANGGGEAWQLWGEFERTKKPEFLTRLDALARSGNDVAKNFVGFAFDHGFGVPENPLNAAAYFNWASAKYPLAAYNLGLLYLKGRGVAKNEAMAMRLFSQAAEQGGIEPAFARIILFFNARNDHAQTWVWAQKAASYNSRTGYYMIGKMLLDGTAPTGDQVGVGDALSWLTKAAEMYSAAAANQLSRLYRDGKGVDRNLTMAAAWKIIAAGIGKQGAGQVAMGISELGLDTEESQRAQKFATSWLSSHAKPAARDYEHTLAKP